MAKQNQDLYNAQEAMDHSVLMQMAFQESQEASYFKGALFASLLFTLIMIWVPLPKFKGKVFTATQAEQKIVKRKVLKPPPEKPLDRVQKREKSSKKVPMPDLTPDEPEPIVEPEPPPEPEVEFTDDWEIGIPDAPPEQATETIARVGMVGVEPPIFTHKESPSYPAKAVKVKITGYVILEAILRKDGSVDDIQVLKGLGKGKFGFEEEAMNALKKWQFLPGKVNGKPADVRMTLKIDFVLQ